MCKVRVASIQDGLIPSERVVSIRVRGGGAEEVAVNESQTDGMTVEAEWIGAENGSVLVELPRETASGRRRIWVDKCDLVGTPA